MCEHNFTIYSTSIEPASLLAVCKSCQEKGRVLNFNRAEWDRAVDKVKFDIETERVETEDWFGFNFNSEF